MDKIEKDFKNVKKISLNELIVKNSKIPPKANPAKGSQYTSLGIDDMRLFDVKYKYFEPTTQKIYEKTDTSLKARKSISYYYYLNPSSNNELSIVVLGDSFGQHITEYLKYSFRSTTRIFIPNNPAKFHNGKNIYLKKIENIHPNIMIICLFKSGLDVLNQFNDME